MLWPWKEKVYAQVNDEIAIDKLAQPILEKYSSCLTLRLQHGLLFVLFGVVRVVG